MWESGTVAAVDPDQRAIAPAFMLAVINTKNQPHRAFFNKV